MPLNRGLCTTLILGDRFDVNVEYINPFISSLHEIFGSMLGSGADRGEVGVVKDDFKAGTIVAMIGISGPITGTVAISLPKDTALNSIKALLDKELNEVDDTVTDGVSELVNMIAGSAKAKMTSEKTEPAQLSLPTVVYGDNYQVNYPTECTWLEVPFTTDHGPLTLRVALKSNTG